MLLRIHHERRYYAEIVCKVIFISVLYPMLQVAMYAVTGDIVGLTRAFITFIVWLMIVLLFVFLSYGCEKEEKDESIV